MDVFYKSIDWIMSGSATTTESFTLVESPTKAVDSDKAPKALNVPKNVDNEAQQDHDVPYIDPSDATSKLPDVPTSESSQEDTTDHETSCVDTTETDAEDTDKDKVENEPELDDILEEKDSKVPLESGQIAAANDALSVDKKPVEVFDPEMLRKFVVLQQLEKQESERNKKRQTIWHTTKVITYSELIAQMEERKCTVIEPQIISKTVDSTGDITADKVADDAPELSDTTDSISPEDVAANKVTSGDKETDKTKSEDLAPELAELQDFVTQLQIEQNTRIKKQESQWYTQWNTHSQIPSYKKPVSQIKQRQYVKMVPCHRQMPKPSRFGTSYEFDVCFKPKVNDLNDSSMEWNRGRTFCRYYGSEAGCNRGDRCAFSHSNPNSVPFCKFRGRCRKKDQCEYRHQEFNRYTFM